MNCKFLILGLSACLSASAAVPTGYYDSLAGKSGKDLLQAVKSAARPDGFSTVTYNTKTWDAFLQTDVRTIAGRTVWWDMYSNNMVFTDAHASLNIEHSVANSWWGGNKKVAPYEDLFHLNPADQEANGRKSDLPLGEVASISYTNGLSKVGAPAAGKAGTATKVFEPADEYKGDFARAYLYIFTAFADIDATWKAGAMYTLNSAGHPELQPWAVEMLCRWAKEDPVDSKEIERNDRIFNIQHNRNPFIDHPELIDYLWGDSRDKAYTLSEAAGPCDRPEAPVFSDRWMRGIATYSGRWWEGVTIPVSSEAARLWISLDGNEYLQYGSSITIPSASAYNRSITLRAYAEDDVMGRCLRSPLATLTLTPASPDSTDYSFAIWQKVSYGSNFSASDRFILVAPSVGHIMSADGGTSSVKYMPDAGFVEFTDKDITTLPVDAATLRFRPADQGKYLVEIADIYGNSKGFWNMASSGNNNTLNPFTGTPASVAFDDDGNALIDFGSKKIKYNASQPRFTNYGDNSSTAAPVCLYRFSSMPDLSSLHGPELPATAPDPISIDGRTVSLPAGWQLYSINGARMAPGLLEPGIYIAVHPDAKPVKILIP